MRIAGVDHHVFHPGKDKIGPFGLLVVKHVGELVEMGEGQVAALLKRLSKGDNMVLSVFERRQGRILRHHRRASHQGVMHLEDFLDVPGVGMEVADPPARHPIGFGEGENPHNTLPDIGDLSRTEIGFRRVDKILIGLINNQKEIMPFGQRNQGARFRFREDRPGRIVRVAVQNRSRVWRQTGLKRFFVKGKILLLAERSEARGTAGDANDLLVGGIAGRGQNDLIPRAGEGQQRCGNGLNRTAGNNNLPVRVVVHGLLQQRLGNALAQLGQARGQRVGGALTLGDFLLDKGFDRFGRIKAGDALGQRDHVRHPTGRQFHRLDGRQFNAGRARK